MLAARCSSRRCRARPDRRPDAGPRAGFGGIVYDPTNYAQNVLTAAARTLEQINNQITSLQNEAQMLINQARNLASLPYSSLQQLQQNVQRTQQLLGQAQNIAFDVQRSTRRSSSLRQCSMSATDQQLVADARDALAEHGRRFAGRHARAGRRRRQYRHQPHADVGAGRPEPGRDRRACRRRRPATSFSPCRRSSSPTSPRCRRRQRPRAGADRGRARHAAEQGREQRRRFLTPGGLPARQRQMFGNGN
jgi:conjugal transfer/entry exclusion protein